MSLKKIAQYFVSWFPISFKLCDRRTFSVPRYSESSSFALMEMLVFNRREIVRLFLL